MSHAYDWRQMLVTSNYERRANHFRPTDPVAIAEEVRRQAAAGLAPNDIAQALRLDVAAVRNMLGKEETIHG